MRVRTSRPIPSLVGLILLAGCASGSGGTAQGDQTLSDAVGSRIAVEAHNTIAPPATVFVKLRAPGRPEKRLGNVGPNETETFIVETSDIIVGYVLVAERGQGRELVSDPIDTISRAVINWNMGVNLVTVDRLP